MNLLDLMVRIGVDDQATSKIGGISDGIKGALGGAAKVAAKATGAAVAATVGIAAAGAATIGRAAADSYAEFEQLEGGVQAIYDEMDTSRIIDDARAAYETLGMSANEYLGVMTTVGATFASTLGDEAGYETAKEGLQAISDYSSGTGRDLSELSEKYQLITRSTSSYQSIADQFSGILPATSAGFLEAAQAAGYLGEEYTSLTEVPIDEYQQAVTHMMSDGVGALGLAGNTAREATQTITGSMAMLRSAWQNLTTDIGSGSDRIGESADALVDSISAVLDNAIPLVERIATSLTEALPNIVPKLMEAVQGVLTSIAELLPQVLPPLIDAVLQALDMIVEVLPQILPVLIDAVVTIVEAIAQMLPTLIPILFDAAVQLFMALVQAAPTIIGSLLTAVGTVLNNAVDAVLGAVGSMLSAGMEFIGGLFQGVSDGFRGIVDFFGSIPSKILGFFGDAGSWLLDAGSNIINGFLDGLKGAWGGITSFVGGIGDWIVSHKGPEDYDKKLLVNAGQLIMGGLNRGLESGIPALEKTLGSITDTIQGGVSADVSLSGKYSQAAPAGIIIKDCQFNVRDDDDIQRIADAIGRMVTRQSMGRVFA